MTDFFKSALGGMFGGQNAGPGGQSNSSSSNNPGGTSASSSSSSSAFQSSSNNANNDFVGHSIQVGSARLRVTRMLAEGGYAIVYVAQDISTGVDYALKVAANFFYQTLFKAMIY